MKGSATVTAPTVPGAATTASATFSSGLLSLEIEGYSNSKHSYRQFLNF